MSTPYRQIRALYDDTTITVYQAYNSTIASAAVEHQKLNASPAFRIRMTWVKPSWTWMLYRAGYSYKDANQERILALKMKHADFIALLEKGVAEPPTGDDDNKGDDNQPEQSETATAEPRRRLPEVRIQWDPERSVRIGRLEHRSIQIGIPGSLSERWVEEMIVGIEDVTDKARELKRVLDERDDVSVDELIRLGLVPVERPFQLPEALQRGLGMI